MKQLKIDLIAESPPTKPKRRKPVCRLCGGDGKRAEEKYNKETGEYEVKLIACICEEKK